MLRKLILVALTIGYARPSPAQSEFYVESHLPALANPNFTWGVSKPAAISVVDRGIAAPKPDRYADLPYWSGWLTAATSVLESAQLNFVDITSLTFAEPTQRAALLRAIAYNVLDNRVSDSFGKKSGGLGKLKVRFLFGQAHEPTPLIPHPHFDNNGFGGSAGSSMAPSLAADFLEQLRIAYNIKYKDQYGTNAFNKKRVPPFYGGLLNSVVQFAVVYAYWGVAPAEAPIGGNWNHSKIVSNGRQAVVGGTNMYNDYLFQSDGTGVILDADLLVSGQPAIYASRWVDTLYSEYSAVVGRVNAAGVVRMQMLGLITFESQTPSIKQCKCASTENTDETYCRRSVSYFQRDGLPLKYSDLTNGCFWPGGESGRVDASWYGLGASVPAADPGTGPTIISAGERGGRAQEFSGFIGTGNPALTAEQVAAYDNALGNLIWSADNNAGTEIMISQQDYLNSAAFTDDDDLHFDKNTGAYIGGAKAAASNQRFQLADRIAFEMMKAPQDQHLRVYLIKSSSADPGYTLIPVYKVVHVLYKNVMQRLEWDWNHYHNVQTGEAKPTTFAQYRLKAETTLENQFCKIFQAAKFKNNGQYTRLHNKLVMVASPTAGAAGVSIGSLNFYNALMMNDYGNIVFDDQSAGTVTDNLHRRFSGDWIASEYPTESDKKTPRHCWWQTAH